MIAEEQNGFRSKRSCSEHVFSLYSIIQDRIQNSRKAYIAFVNFPKAFNGVDRKLLYYKLMHSVCKMYFTIKALYSLTIACLEINGTLTPSFQTLSGVYHGDSMSPTLFSIFINDLAGIINESNLGVKIGNKMFSILLYADDIVLMADQEDNLQKMLNILYDWWNVGNLVI